MAGHRKCEKPAVPPEPQLCENTHSFEIQIQCIRINWDCDETIPRMTSMDYGDNYMFMRFVHPYMGHIETIPTRLQKTYSGWCANHKADISLFVRTDIAHFWRNLKIQPVVCYLCRKGRIFDEIVGVNFLNFGQLQPHYAGEGKEVLESGRAKKSIYDFNVPVRIPIGQHEPAFYSGRMKMTVSITDHGQVYSEKFGPAAEQITIDAKGYFMDDLKKWFMRQKDRSSAFYRCFLEFRPAEYELQRRMLEMVKEIEPIINSAEVQRIVKTAERRTLMNSRRLENTLAECLRSAEDVRDAVGALENERGAVTRLFEHLHATYVEMMERNKTPSNEHFSYDLLSGKQMDQKRRGMTTLKTEVYNGLSRLREFVEAEHPENLATLDKALYDIKSAYVPSFKSILCGDYYRPSMDEPVKTYGMQIS